DGRGAAGTGSDWIKHVGLEEISNTSIQEYYGDYTDSVTRLVQNHTYNLELTLNFHFDLNKVAAWIDYNLNAEFDDNERITMGAIDASHSSIGTFTVPSDVVLDKDLRLRVVCRYTANDVNPCGFVAGEVEDYTVIAEKDTLSSVPKIDEIIVRVYPNPNDGSFVIDFDKVQSKTEVKMFDQLGRVVYKGQTCNGTQCVIDSKLPAGIYLLELKTDNQKRQVKVIIE
ncbi:MAG: hypothetical protein ACI8SE_001218, partial [Bacteroidia bacterium]